MKNSKLIGYGAVQALVVFIYTSGVAFLLSNGEKLFNDKGKPDTFWQPAAMLMLFVVSAAITGSAVLGKPICLYLDGFKKEAVKLLAYTIIFLILIAFAVFAGIIFW